jgi:hypothetical protein
MTSGHKSVQRLVFCLAAVLAIASLVAGCAHVFSAGPSHVTPEGVRVTIRDFECRQVSETEKGADLVVDMEISNKSAVPLVVRAGAMQIVDAEGGSMARRGWSQKGPIQVAPGSNQSLTMHFLGPQTHCCSSRLSLDPTGVTAGDRTLAMTPIDFVPECLF